jgi:hypothetical protein
MSRHGVAQVPSTLSSALSMAAALLLGSAHLASAEEKNVAREDVPDVVLESVTKKYPDGRVVQFVEVQNEDGSVYYEAWMEESGNRQVSLHVLPSGEILAEETKILPTKEQEQSKRAAEQKANEQKTAPAPAPTP